MTSGSTVLACCAGRRVSHFRVSGKRVCQGSVAHRHTSSGNKCNAKRRIFFFFFFPSHIIKLQHTLPLSRHSSCPNTFPLLVQTRPPAFLVFAAVFGGSCSSSATAGGRQFARLERRCSRHALRPALCRHHHCRGRWGVGGRSSVWGRAIVCQPRKREKSIPACQHLVITVNMWLIVCPWILLYQRVERVTAEGRRHKKQGVFFSFLWAKKKKAKKKMSVHDEELAEQLQLQPCAPRNRTYWKTDEDRMNKQEKDGRITATY